MAKMIEIKSEEEFRKLIQKKEGIILITDNVTGDHVHLTTCDNVAEKNFVEKVIANNNKNGRYFWGSTTSSFNSASTKFTACTNCKPTDFEKLSGLNVGGTFLQIAVHEKLKNENWPTIPEFPISLAPFVTDPMKHDIALKRINIGNGTEVKTSSNNFQRAIAESQNQFFRKETSIDILAQKTTMPRDYVLCIEVKKLNPEYVNWVFFDEGTMDNKFRVRTKSLSNQGIVNLLKIHESDRHGNEIFIHIEEFTDIPNFQPNCYDYGVTLTKDKEGNYSFQKSSLYDASLQIVESTYGALVDALINQVSTGMGYVPSQVFIPIIVTNANLLICDYDKKDIDLEKGIISNADFKSVNSIIYEIPTPMRAKFPNEITTNTNGEMTRTSSRWPILIMNPKGLDEFLSNFDKDVFSKGKI